MSFNPLKSIGSVLKTGLSVIPGVGDYLGVMEANEANKEMASDQMRFQERMSSTAYQRAMADMKKSGLNPMLAFSQGGASTPQGAMATAQPKSASKLGEAAISTALELNRQKNEIKRTEIQDKQVQSQTQLNTAQAAKTAADTKRTMMDTEIKKRELPISDMMNKYSDKASQYINQAIESLSSSAKEMKQAEDKAIINYKNSPAAKDAAKRRKK